MTRVETIGAATLYLGDCLDVVPKLLACDALVSDPPYGIGYKVNRRGPRGRGRLLKGMRETVTDSVGPIAGDDRPFDPYPWLSAPRLAFFGANNFAHRLPKGGRWIVWDKRDGMAADDHADAELIWTNVPGVVRIHRQKWRGVVRAGEENCSRSKKLHPNQKPVALMGFILGQIGAPWAATISDPYMGSGSTGVAAVRKGFKFIGCEIDPKYFQVAVDRLAREVDEVAA